MCERESRKYFFLKHLNQKKKAKIYSKMYGNSVFNNLKILKKKHIIFLKSLKAQLKFSINKEKNFF